MKVRFLGTGAGGGLPQWNCACAGCQRARKTATGRTQDCLAITGDGTAWFLVNASPDLRTQIVAAPELTPGPGRRDTPLRGVLLTDAELDHTLGLVTLREASALTVYGTATALNALRTGFPAQSILAEYTTVDWQVVTPGQPVDLTGGLSAVAVPLGVKMPRYMGSAARAPIGPASLTSRLPGPFGLADSARPAGEWVVAYRFKDARTGGVLVYAPCLAGWSSAFDAAVAEASCVILDGTFRTDDEMTTEAGGGATARSMGHLPIEDSLPRLRGRTGIRYIYTHLNNTNPMAYKDSVRHDELTAAGAEIAEDGQLIEV